MDLIERWDQMRAAKSLKRGESEEKAKDREHIQRISGIRESDLRRMSRKPARPASRGSAGEKTEAKKKNAGKKRFRGHAGNGRRSRLEGAEVQEDDH